MSSAARRRATAGELTDQQIRHHTWPLLTRAAELRPSPRVRKTYTPFPDADLVQLLVHQDGDNERVLTDADVAKVGERELLMLVRERARRIPTDESDVVRLDGGEFHVLRGTSEFFASKILLLPEPLRPVLGLAAENPLGVLVSVPSRRELVVGAVDGNLPATLVHLARYTLMTYEDCRDPLSGDTYWWHGGTLTPVVTRDGTGHVDFRLPPAFFDAAGPSPGITLP